MGIERIFVAGAGLMGHGIGQVHAAIGKHVVLYEPDLSRAQAGRERIAGNLERALAKGKIDSNERDATVGRIVASDDVDLARSADLIIEAVFEDAGVKHRSEVYAGAGHGYTLADTPVYDEQACERHFAALFDLLDRALAR